MAIREILTYPDPRLRTIAKPVEAVDQEIKTLVDDMIETMYDANGIGLAATQIDVHLQVIVMDIGEERDSPLVLINPKIVKKDGEQIYDEGCLSVPEYYAPVKRAETITITALDQEGEIFELDADGLLAVCIQHEMDHLAGKVFVDYLSRLKQDRVRKKLLRMSKIQMRVVFAGTPEFAATALRAIVGEHEVVAVLTQPDRRAGRGKKLLPSAVKTAAVEHQIAVLQPEKLKPLAHTLAEFDADVMVVVAYGMLIPQSILDIPKFGCLNIHASILPRWRGAAPIQRAIEAGDTLTGVSIMQMEAGLDTGPVYKTLTTPIRAGDTSGSLHLRLADLGAKGIIEVLSELESGAATPPLPQDNDAANYARKLEKHEANIDWRESASVINQKIRAFMPWPISQTKLNGHRLRIWKATPIEHSVLGEPGEILAIEDDYLAVQCGQGQLRIQQLQKDGGKPLDIRAFTNGFDLSLGQCFESAVIAASSPSELS